MSTNSRQHEQKNMKIVLFRNYKEESQLSMKGYGDCISKKLKEKYPQWDIIDFYPRIIGRRDTYKSKDFQKIIDFINRYIYYPMQIKNIKADVYHIIDHGNALFMKEIPSERTIITCHDLIPMYIDRGYFKKIKKPPFGLYVFKYSLSFFKKARYIFADSNNTMKDIIEVAKVREDKIITIPLAPFYPFKKNSSEKRAVYCKKFNLEGDKLVILNVGAPIFYKNVDGLLRTLYSLPARINGKEWIFYHIGPPYSAAQLSGASSDFINNHLRQPGVVGFEELEFFYNVADVLFFPSLYEGFGMPVLEAMTTGLPVITTSVASLVEVGGDAVLYVNPHEIQDMGTTLIDLLSNMQLRKDLIEKGLKRSQLFNWDTSIDKMSIYYQATAES